MQEVDDKKLSDLSKRFLQAISYCGLSGYKLKKDNSAKRKFLILISWIDF